ncbi:carbohydrate ABC transporter permease [Aureimonas sp. AU4]|uniref:carbohydrate ABC transporter permease n=1 Tax=Aureimonas sp. AU4 TaxID=1638163 RepID=UPI0007820C1C|nr:sugar ABC transporter permease [Aureimonas sp. AU4]
MTLTRRTAPYVFLAPVFVFGLLFFVGPLLFSLVLSFASWNSLGAFRLVGWQNYRYLLAVDPVFHTALWNTARFVGLTILLGVPLALALALAIRRSRIASVWQAIYWLPMITNVVAVSYVWKQILDDPYGLVNRFLAFLGVAGPSWLLDPDWAMLSLVLVFLWFQVGQDMMLFLAGLNGLDSSIEEAARMDGASGWRTFRHVTLPLLAPTMLFVTLSNLIRGVGYFALMLILTEGGPVNSTRTAALRMYELAFSELKLGMASAAAYILLFVVMLLSAIQLRVMRRGGVEGWA